MHMAAAETIFSKIIRREVPATIVYQDDDVTAFLDIRPVAPTHVLIVPNTLIPTLNDATPDHQRVLGKMLLVAAQIAREQGIAQNGYRVAMNVNGDGGQEVFHIHLHLLGGRRLRGIG
jgi:histidine triad (HIT) family protein